MTPEKFINQYKEYFGAAAPLPIAVVYSNEPLGAVDTVPGCMFKRFHKAFKGETVTFDAASLTCGGGRLYTGFGPVPSRVYDFVSMTERYKMNPAIAKESIDRIAARISEKPYLNFIRIDSLTSFDEMEGLIFFATPDIMAGLFTWANYDCGDLNAVQAPFGSGCSATVTSLVNENRRSGKHCYIGLFDISARPFFKPDILSFAIPRLRFIEMCATMSQCCISGAPAWLKVRKRINSIRK